MSPSQKRIYWAAYSSGRRHQDIDSIQKAISKSGGYIVDFKLFSDLVVGLNIEIEEGQIVYLRNALEEFLSFKEPFSQQLDPQSETEWTILMNVSFSRGKGNLKSEIPMVPG